MRLNLVTLVLMLAAAAPALADDADIMQIKQSFEPGSADVAAGASLNFVNADDVNHNLVLISPDGTQNDRGLEKPGETTRISFATAGLYTVICHIHPRMKFKVTVH